MVFGRMRENRRYKSELASYETALADWESEHDHVEDLLYLATHVDEVYEAAAEAGFSVRLGKDEHVVFAALGGGLVEPRSSGGSYQGGSQGASFRVMKGVSYRVGAHKGTYVPGPEVQKIIDSGGNIYITTQKVVYTSPNRNRDWAYAKTVDMFHSDAVVPGIAATYIGVSNRQKTSGFVYPVENARQIRDRLVLALAIFDGTVEELAVGLKSQKADLDRARPVAPIEPQG